MSVTKYSKHLVSTSRQSRRFIVNSLKLSYSLATRNASTLAMSLSNTAKTLKTPFVGAIQMLADPLLTEHYAKVGFGAVFIDQQHGLLDERTAFECVQRLEKFQSCFPIVRVCDNTPSLISRALDAGACGIVAPMINNVDDAKQFVEQCRYAPVGKRSWGPTRALIVDAGTEQANSYVKAFAMIETAEAIKNLDTILDLDGLDGAFVGPSDLSISLGVAPSGSPTDPMVVAAIKKVLQGCQKRNKLSLLYCGDKERAKASLAEGWSGVFPGTDVRWMIAAAKDIVDVVKN